MAISINLELPDNLYLRNPEQTELGRKIVDYGIQLIDELGLEKFTFKKLANAIGSTEASVYRYFENKHKLLIYLVAWYWSYVEYMIDYQTHNIDDPVKQLQFALQVLADSVKYDPNFSHIDETALHRIVVVESNKAYFTKQVDGDNREGLFQGFKNLCERLVEIIHAVSPEYRFPHALATTLIESSHQQIFFAQNLPSLTELKVVDEDTTQIAKYLEDIAFRILGKD